MPGVLELLEHLDSSAWRFTMTRTKTGCRTWRLYHRGESSPRLTLRES